MAGQQSKHMLGKINWQYSWQEKVLLDTSSWNCSRFSHLNCPNDQSRPRPINRIGFTRRPDTVVCNVHPVLWTVHSALCTGRHSALDGTLYWTALCTVRHSLLNATLYWTALCTEWHSVLNNTLYWTALCTEQHSVLNDTLYWTTLCTGQHSLLDTGQHSVLDGTLHWMELCNGRNSVLDATL